MHRPLIFVIVSLLIFQVKAQEIVSELQYNPGAAKAMRKNATKASGSHHLLPFFENFHNTDEAPSLHRWSDRNVYISQGFAMYPPNYGVATFDALDSTGHIYGHATYTPFEADRLTSVPIRLDSVFHPVARSVRKADSLYFSFFFQPQGKGNPPQKNDSLLVYFFNPVDSLWNRVWGSEGMPLDTFRVKYGSDFRQVMIPIQDSVQYYHPGFRFRFVNYASLASAQLPAWQSSMDHWNVDYIYLNINRHYADTTYRDLGFVDVSNSMLKTYHSMPYTHYSNDPTREMNDTLYTVISSLDVVGHLSKYSYTVFDANYQKINSYSGGNYSIFPVYDSGYVTYAPYASPRITTILPIDPLGLKDSADFIIRHELVADYSPDDRLYDTLEVRQVFRNYFAYDDGTPEAGYGITPAGSMGAVRFTLNTRDTVRAVQIYFNPTRTNSNEQYFHLCIWDDNNGLPDKLLSKDTLVIPEFLFEAHSFQTFVFEEPVPVRNAFFVGWITTTNDNLNMGFDRSRNSRNMNFFNTGGGWQHSQHEGSVMIRPIVGKALKNQNPLDPPAKSLTIGPNPLTGEILRITPPWRSNPEVYSLYRIEIFTLTGSKVMSMPYQSECNLGNLPAGLYVLRLLNEKGIPEGSSKLMVPH